LALAFLFLLSSPPLKTPVASRMPPAITRTRPAPTRMGTVLLLPCLRSSFFLVGLAASRSSSRWRGLPGGPPGFLMAPAGFLGVAGGASSSTWKVLLHLGQRTVLPGAAEDFTSAPHSGQERI